MSKSNRVTWKTCQGSDRMSKSRRMRCVRDNRNIWLKKDQRDRYRDRRSRDREKTVAHDHSCSVNNEYSVPRSESTVRLLAFARRPNKLSARSKSCAVQLARLNHCCSLVLLSLLFFSLFALSSESLGPSLTESSISCCVVVYRWSLGKIVLQRALRRNLERPAHTK
jgi:hypothetical protein